MTENRKPIIIALVCVGVAILVVVFGVGLGGRSTKAPSGLSSALSGVGGAATLRASDLRVVGGSCGVTSARILVQSPCTLRIASFGGGLSLGPAVKKANLVPQSVPVSLEVTVEGTTMSKVLEAGKAVGVTFGTSGGSLRITCVGATSTPCILDIRASTSQAAGD